MHYEPCNDGIAKLLNFSIAFSFLEFQCEAVFSVFVTVFSVLGFAVVACVGLDCELSVFPCFGWFGVFFFAVWALSHDNHRFCFCLCWFKTFYRLLGCLWFFGL